MIEEDWSDDGNGYEGQKYDSDRKVRKTSIMIHHTGAGFNAHGWKGSSI